MARVVKANPGALTSSYFSTGNPMYVSRATGTRRSCRSISPGRAGLDVKSDAGEIRAAAAAGLPAGISVDVTGRDALGEASTTSTGAPASCWRR